MKDDMGEAMNNEPTATREIVSIDVSDVARREWEKLSSMLVDLEPERREIARRALTTLIHLNVVAVAMPAGTLGVMEAERNAALATLETLAAEKVAAVKAAADSVIWNVVSAVLGRVIA